MNATQYTKWHKFLAAFSNMPTPDRRLFPKLCDDLELSKEFYDSNKEVFGYISTWPFFRMDLEINEIVKSDYEDWVSLNCELSKAVGGVFHPFPKYVIEFIWAGTRTFLAIEEGDNLHFKMSAFQVHTHPNFDYPHVAFVDGHVFIDEATGNYSLQCDGPVAEPEHCIHGMIIGFMRFRLMLATRGYEREEIPAPKFLNKQRARKGKPPIPGVTVIKIGHYYSRDGERHTYDERKPVRIHWRRGHMRGVWCGTGEERHLEQRYIFPCLVNYQPGDTVPPQQVRVLQ